MREYQHNRAYACPFNALVFRKKTFLQAEGFRGNLKYIRGEYDFMVNKYAKADNLTFENSDEGTLIEEAPTDKVWLGGHLFYMENRQHLERTTRHRLLPYIDRRPYMAIMCYSVQHSLSLTSSVCGPLQQLLDWHLYYLLSSD